MSWPLHAGYQPLYLPKLVDTHHATSLWIYIPYIIFSTIVRHIAGISRGVRPRSGSRTDNNLRAGFGQAKYFLRDSRHATTGGSCRSMGISFMEFDPVLYSEIGSVLLRSGRLQSHHQRVRRSRQLIKLFFCLFIFSLSNWDLALPGLPSSVWSQVP